MEFLYLIQPICLTLVYVHTLSNFYPMVLAWLNAQPGDGMAMYDDDCTSRQLKIQNASFSWDQMILRSSCLILLCFVLS